MADSPVGKVAVLIDGGFYRYRAKAIWGDKPAMKRFVKCFFELLTENFSAWRETGQKRGAKRACGRLEAVFMGR